MEQTITNERAERALKAVEKAFSSWIEEGYGPKLVQDWDDHEWVIIWEMGAPYDWVYLIGGGIEEEYGFRVEPTELPRGIWAEPVNNCVLALYNG